MPTTHKKYVWPASALTASDMALLHAVRESSDTRATISGLVAGAVRSAYGTAAARAAPGLRTPPAPTGAATKGNTQ